MLNQVVLTGNLGDDPSAHYTPEGLAMPPSLLFWKYFWCRRRLLYRFMSVHKIVEIVGTSPKSWEDATQKALATAAKSLEELRVAEVVRQDVTIEKGKITANRCLIDSYRNTQKRGLLTPLLLMSGKFNHPPSHSIAYIGRHRN